MPHNARDRMQRSAERVGRTAALMLDSISSEHTADPGAEREDGVLPRVFGPDRRSRSDVVVE
jgi:hypothetical protein